MENKKILGVYPIIHNDKIQSLRTFLNITKQMYGDQKIDLSSSEFISYLKNTCYDIEVKINSTDTYYQSNKAITPEIREALEKCEDLSILFLKYIADLNQLGIDKNEYLNFRKERNDAFDFRLGPKENKEPVENHLEIAKEFEKILDSIKIETSTETKKSTGKNIMFLLGVRLATGDLDNYYTVNDNKETQTKNGFSIPKIADELGHPEWNKFILATLNFYKKGQNTGKNIWINKNTMEQVYKHCKDKKIKMTDFFIEKYNQLLQD